MCRFEDVRMCGCADLQMGGFEDVRMCGLADFLGAVRWWVKIGDYTFFGEGINSYPMSLR